VSLGGRNIPVERRVAHWHRNGNWNDTRDTTTDVLSLSFCAGGHAKDTWPDMCDVPGIGDTVIVQPRSGGERT